MGFSSVDSFIIAFSTRDPRSGGIAARRCFILGHPGSGVFNDAYFLKAFFLIKLYHLSLSSTATQNIWRLGLALGNVPDARILRWGYQHVGANANP